VGEFLTYGEFLKVIHNSMSLPLAPAVVFAWCTIGTGRGTWLEMLAREFTSKIYRSCMEAVDELLTLWEICLAPPATAQSSHPLLQPHYPLHHRIDNSSRDNGIGQFIFSFAPSK
jgi:hypothetical protein